ncbi:MAG: multiheme c-type cytochrome [Halieaceae bacterium]|nr:multiheme c-type cytochrome [Halieaceae bacterium]
MRKSWWAGILWVLASQASALSGEACVACHSKVTPGQVVDWEQSKHAAAGISCIDCHQVDKDSPMATQHATLKGSDVFVSVLVSPATCEVCHEEPVAQFNASGHFRSYHQIIPKDNLHALTNVHEGRSHPEFQDAPKETGCMQCHGTEILLDTDGRPTPETWPNNGMGNIYPDGATGNCTACHSRHRFDIAEARRPAACASCHLGPDHPNIEIFNNSKHGHLYNTTGNDWTWDSPTEEWQPGDYRGPTCATCHMSGIGKLELTHNISERLYWNLWAQESKVRGSDDVLSPLLGDGPAGRKKMKQVCNTCHTSLHTDGYFAQGDKAVNLYNEAYYRPAKAMLEELRGKGLLKENPWTDEFQIVFYHLWHHEGRRARQGAMKGAADYAHWHGFFELQQDLYKLEQIYEQRMNSGRIETQAAAH